MQKLSTTFWRASAYFCSVLFALAIFFLAPSFAFAKDEPAAAPQGTSFMLSYILVILFIVLGVIAVVRPTRRMEDDTDL